MTPAAPARRKRGETPVRNALVTRALMGGVGELSDETLVQLVLAGRESGLSRALLGRYGLDRLSRATAAELAEGRGIRPRDASRLAAAFELGRRVVSVERTAPVDCRSPEAVFRVVAPLFAGLERESFVALLLDGKHRLERVECVSVGTLTSSLVHPREVFRAALREGAAALVVAHNHPSGDPEPSQEDLAVTRRLRRAGRLLGVPLLDHVVVGAARYVSLRERAW